jgi:hypothetical protein
MDRAMVSYQQVFLLMLSGYAGRVVENITRGKHGTGVLIMVKLTIDFGPMGKGFAILKGDNVGDPFIKLYMGLNVVVEFGTEDRSFMFGAIHNRIAHHIFSSILIRIFRLCSFRHASGQIIDMGLRDPPSHSSIWTGHV